MLKAVTLLRICRCYRFGAGSRAVYPFLLLWSVPLICPTVSRFASATNYSARGILLSLARKIAGSGATSRCCILSLSGLARSYCAISIFLSCRL